MISVSRAEFKCYVAIIILVNLKILSYKRLRQLRVMGF